MFGKWLAHNKGFINIFKIREGKKEWVEGLSNHTACRSGSKQRLRHLCDVPKKNSLGKTHNKGDKAGSQGCGHR